MRHPRQTKRNPVTQMKVISLQKTRRQHRVMLPALEQATSAAVGGAIATAALFPLDALRTKLAASTRPGDSALKTVARVLETQGVFGLFGGLSPKLMQVGRTVCFAF